MTMLLFFAAVQFSIWLCLTTGLQPFPIPFGDPRNTEGHDKYSDVSIIRHDSKGPEYVSLPPFAVKHGADSHVKTIETHDVSGDEDALAWNKTLSTGMSPLRHDDVTRSDLPPPAYNVKVLMSSSRV
ncbi:hypothetical protein V1264_015522 [Littorina saxatilis]|uniref:Uncharacterized protein n=1 Tax=Littorina saxatilis TaxID=31220 RepID=A0AAN9BK57_9CAEN